METPKVDVSSTASSLSRMEKLVGELEQLSPMISSHLVEQLRGCLANLPSKLSQNGSLQAWKLSYSIWNSCVDFANNLQLGQELDEDHAKLRQVASDLLFLAGGIDGIDSSLLKIATFFYRTGAIWHQVKSFEMAHVCFEKATELMSKFHEEQERSATPRSKEEQQFFFDLLVARSNTAWELSHTALACSLLGRAKGLLVLLREAEHNLKLAEQFFQFGTSLLTKEDVESQADSIKYLEQAYEICCNAANLDGPETGVIVSLKVKTLRYLAAGHLQRDNFESVLKCLVILKAAPQHPSTSYLAVKALAGLGRYEEAEKELITLIGQSESSMEACLSAIETIIHAPNRLEIAKRAFVALQSRHPSNKILLVRVLDCMLRQLPNLDVHDTKGVEAALEIATNEETVATIMDVGQIEFSTLHNVSCTNNSKEQQSVHAMLWNSGSEYFQAKNYELSIRLFETSMLYLSPGFDSNPQRAKSLRVLCICRLALLQYDRAYEYVAEAEKIDPNIVCAFLKFKIHLQTGNEAAAAEQVEKMVICKDFEPEYLCIASHEAVICNCTKVALSALTNYLNLPSEKRRESAKEVVLIRNIVNLALQDENHREEALKHLKEGQKRLADVGCETFFGSGSLGEQEANWFASTSWNQGLLAVKSQEWQLSTEFFSCASDFFSSLPESRENLQCLQKSLLLAISSLLASNPGDESIRPASRMLDKCRKVHRALAMSKDRAVTEVADETSEIHLNLLAFDLKGRNKDYKSQLDILYHCSSLSSFKACHFLMMAGKTSGTITATEVANTSYRLALKAILSSTSPEYKSVAMILRKLIELADQQSKDGPAVLAMYKEAKDILASSETDDYPEEELLWLIATSWNRAGLQVKFSRFSEAEAWMEIALEIANYAPDLESRKLSMIEGLNQVRQQRESIALRS